MVEKINQFNWNNNCPIFASEAYLKTLNKPFYWLRISLPEQPSYILPCVERPGPIRILQFLTQPFLDSGTTDLGEDFNGSGIEAQLEERLFRTLIKYLRFRVHVISRMPANAFTKTAPVGARAYPFGSIVVDLKQSEEVLWDNLHSKHRNVIRGAKNKGVEIFRGEKYLEQAYEVYLLSQKRSGNHFISFDDFRKLYESTKGYSEIFVAKENNIVQASALILFSRYAAYYIHGGTGNQIVLGASNLLHYEAMKYFKSIDVQRYDFMGVRMNVEKGSKYEGLRRFKERFGGTLVQGQLWHMGLSPLHYLVWKTVRKMRGQND